MASVVSEGRSAELARVAVAPPMRGMVPGLPTPRTMGAQLPAALQDDEFAMRMVSAFDEVLAPIYCTLDCLDTYLDPQLAPDDFVDWLAEWVGVDIDETWVPERRRQLIRDVVDLYRIRGTAPGLAAHVGLYAGVTPEIEENGACEWSQTADTPMPGSPEPRLTVRLRVDDLTSVRHPTVNRIVAASRPAHVPYRVEVLVHGTAIAGAEEDFDASEVAEDAPGAVALPGSETIELAPQAPPTEEELEAEEPPDESEPTS